ncbi:MAG: MFS transporter [Actinomycetota bacterium]|nr:MFS transporter [Actinomycetota bacterium]
MTAAVLRLHARTFASLRKHRNYRLFFGGQVVSLAGTWMQNLALAWFVVELTDSALAVGGLAFCRFFPFMVFGLFAGVLADRFDNRRLVIATQTGQMAVSIALAALAFSGWDSIPAAYALALLGGVALVFDAPGRQALTFQMVGRDELPNAVALNTGLFNGARIVGPAIAGVIIAVAGVGICFAINAVSFLAVLAGLLMMRAEELFPVKQDRPKRALAAIREGLEYARGNDHVRLALTILAVISTVGLNFHVILPVLASDTLDVGPDVFGILSACFGGGALLGALLQAARGRASWKLLLIGATGFSGGLLAMALADSVLACAVLLFAVGVAFTLWIANTSSLLQLAAPDRLRGRVMSLFMFAFAGLAPIGGLFAGWLMEVGGTPLALAVGGITSLAVTGYAWARRPTGAVARPAEALLADDAAEGARAA